MKIRVSWFDNVVGFFSPQAENSRLRHKLHNEYLKRKYEGADSGRRTHGWKATNTSANAEIQNDLGKLRNRSRDLIRNNPYAARGVSVIANNVVGRGILTQIKVDNRSEVNRRELKLNNLWRAWALDSKACDFDGLHNLPGLQLLAMRAVVESGECLIRVRKMPMRKVFSNGEEITVPNVAFQLLESDFLASDIIFNKKLDNGNFIIQGIEVNPAGQIVAYHLYQNHPGANDIFGVKSLLQTVRVPADEIFHLYRMDRPGQLRGVPWMHPIMLRLRDFDLYEDAQLKRQQCAAMYTAFVHDLSGIDEPVDVKTNEDEECEVGEKMEPGIIEFLPPGKDIKLSSPPGAEHYAEYTSVVLHSIASGLGITYESLTGNLSEVNFSSARMGWLEMARNIDTWRDNIMKQKFLLPAFLAFRASLELLGEKSEGVRPVFTSPRREMIDPTKEVPALNSAIRSGLKTLSEAVRESGYDPDTHFDEIAQDNKTLDKLKLTLDSDPRKDAKQVQAEASVTKAKQKPETSKGEPAEDEE